MPRTFNDLRVEVLARGVQYLSDTAGLLRVGQWLNDAAHEVDEVEAWPYLHATIAGTGTVAIPDLGRVLWVADTSGPRMLEVGDQQQLVEMFGALTLTGQPAWFFVQDPAGVPTVSVFPVSAGTPLSVRYSKIAADMVAGTDELLMPERFREAVVQYAFARALRERSDYEEAAVAQQAGDVIVARMRDFYGERARVSSQVIVDGAGDW